MPKKISMSLNPDSVQNAIDQLETYKSKLGDLRNTLVKNAAIRGTEIAKDEVLAVGAIESGSLQEHIQPIYTDSGKSYVFSGAPHSAFVEFGTGIRGKQKPYEGENLPAGWQYDVNNHGEKGWKYFNPYLGEFHVTRGMASRPFMYYTATRLKNELVPIAKEAIKEVGLDD